MKLDDLPWKPREQARYFDIATIELKSGLFLCIERPINTPHGYWLFWVQRKPFVYHNYQPVGKVRELHSDNLLAAQCALLQFIEEIDDEIRSEYQRAS